MFDFDTVVAREHPRKVLNLDTRRRCAGCWRNIPRAAPCWYDWRTDTARCSECGPLPKEVPRV